jgi:hypothetical protein
MKTSTLAAVAGFLAFGLVAGLVTPDTEDARGAAQAAPQALAPAGSKAACLRAYAKAEEGGILYGTAAGGRVAVDEAAWRGMPLETKRAMAHTIGCAAAGPGNLIPLTFISHTTGEPVGEFGPMGLEVL